MSTHPCRTTADRVVDALARFRDSFTPEEHMALQRAADVLHYAAAQWVPPSDEHGTESTYQNYRCRCDQCNEAHAATQKARRARWNQRLAEDPQSVPHGLLSTYTNHGCRCDECSEARRLANYPSTR